MASLYLETHVNGLPLGKGTGFVVERGARAFLVTNWHVLAGRNPHSREVLSNTGATPDSVTIYHHAGTRQGGWITVAEPVLDSDGEPLWLEHPDHGRAVDVVALPLSTTTGIEFYAHDPWREHSEVMAEAFEGLAPQVSRPLPFDKVFGVTDDVHVVGFPFGLKGGGYLGIWTHGFIATEPSLDYENLPCFLIDARTREGQSGSPVLHYEPPGFVARGEGALVLPGPIELLLGVYSGRVNKDSDLGKVWKASALRAIIEDGARNPGL